MDYAHPNHAQIKVGSLPAIKRILVPVDFSECSYNALRQALIIALRSDAGIVLFHAIHIPMKTAEFSVGSIDQLYNEAQEQLDRLAAEVGSWLKGHGFPALTLITRLITGFPAEEIIKVAEDIGSDLVVMGTNGAGSVEAVLLGSNAATVISNAQCPVLAMPESKILYEMEKLVFATDLEVIDPAALDKAAAIAAVFDAQLDLLHLYTPGETIAPEQLKAFEIKAKELCKYPNLGFTAFETFHENVTLSLSQYVDEYDVQMLALLKRERGFFSRLFHGSVTKKLALKASIPTLVLHE